jgi:2-polyprenyl-3-methyl-5-hydroxy-6-metoxy-1,4-benzoquinol methylase/GT2 family glycosyltransferase
VDDAHPLVSVVVPTKDSGATLERCLTSVRAQDYPALEVVVVDNSSTDDTPRIAAELADVVVTAGPERSAQRNVGLQLATGEWVLWIDSDMVLDPDVCSSAVEAALRDGADAVFVRETSFGDGFWTACRRLERLCYLGEPLIEAPRLVRRALFDEHGGFDGAVAGQEDADLRMRLLAAGARTTRSDGEIHHDEGRLTLRGIVRKRVYYGRSIPAYADARPGAVGAQGRATVRALVRNRALLAAQPVHAVGVVVMRVVEAVAYAVGAAQGRARALDSGPRPPCEACGGPVAPRRLGRRDVLLTCTVCGHVHRDLRLCPANARTHPWGGRRDFDRVRLSLTYRRLRRLAPRRGASVLELGFGTGALLRRFHDDGVSVAGVDRDLLDLEVDPLVRASGALQRASIEQAELPEQAHDLVYGIHVVEHVDDPASVLAKSFATLRPGGRLALLTPDGTSRGLALFRAHWWNLEDPTHIRFFTPDSLTRMVTAAGFVDVEVRRVLLDSLSMETTSMLRVVRRRVEEHGVLEHDWARLLVVALTPATVLARLLVPGLAPTIEVTARRPSAPPRA